MDKSVNSVDNIVVIVDNYTCSVEDYRTFCGKTVGSHSLKQEKTCEKTRTTSSYELWIRW